MLYFQANLKNKKKIWTKNLLCREKWFSTFDESKFSEQATQESEREKTEAFPEILLSFFEFKRKFCVCFHSLNISWMQTKKKWHLQEHEQTSNR